MESGALSDKDFPAFSETVIPFLHVTTKIEGMKYDGLLQEKGFGGFPSLAFMDAEGNVIHKQGDRSVEGFTASMVALPKLADLEKRIAAGEKGLEYDYLLAKWDLGQASYDDVVKACDTIKGLNKKQKATLAAMRIDAEIDHLASSLYVRDPAQREAALKKAAPRFKAILKSDHVLNDSRKGTVWNGLMSYAEMENDIELYAKAVEFFKKMYADEPRAERYLKGLDEKLAKMREGAAAKP